MLGWIHVVVTTLRMRCRPTRSCPKGRTAVLTLRCDPTENGNSTISLPSQWPDGTSDGCNFNFIWKSKAACPTCSSNDYK